MSSVIARRDREQRGPRLSLTDFSEDERTAIERARSFFPGDIVAFGSRARGDWAEDSDLDLGVHGYTHALHGEVKRYLCDKAPFKVDLFKFEHALTHGSAVVV